MRTLDDDLPAAISLKRSESKRRHPSLGSAFTHSDKP